MKRAFTLPREFVQFPGTRVSVDTPFDGIAISVQETFTNLSKEDEYDILSFVNGVLGKYDRFWLPVWSQMFEITNAISTSDDFFYIRDTNFTNAFAGHERIFIEKTDGHIITRQVLSVAPASSDRELVSVVTPFSQNLNLSSIRSCGRFILCRLDSDEIEVNHFSDGMSEISLKFIELLGDYDTEPVGS